MEGGLDKVANEARVSLNGRYPRHRRRRPRFWSIYGQFTVEAGRVSKYGVPELLGRHSMARKPRYIWFSGAQFNYD